MQNPPENGGWHPTSVGETQVLAVLSFPKISAVGKRNLATGGLTPGASPRSGRVFSTRRRIDVPFSVLASYRTPRREKVFGAAVGVPLDRNAKARIIVYTKAYNARMKERGQHTGPVTRAFMDVLRAFSTPFTTDGMAAAFQATSGLRRLQTAAGRRCMRRYGRLRGRVCCPGSTA